MRKKPINPISKKKRQQIEDEKIVRQQLLERCQGRCEICGKLPDWRGLSPHEVPFKSQGGRISMEQSKMVCGKCHNIEGHNIREVDSEPMWGSQ